MYKQLEGFISICNKTSNSEGARSSPWVHVWRKPGMPLLDQTRRYCQLPALLCVSWTVQAPPGMSVRWRTMFLSTWEPVLKDYVTSSWPSPLRNHSAESSTHVRDIKFSACIWCALVIVDVDFRLCVRGVYEWCVYTLMEAMWKCDGTLMCENISLFVRGSMNDCKRAYGHSFINCVSCGV